ncbi:MAG: hypothetical protein U1F43_37695, partial [Myxococcota bacterium]
ALWGATTGIDIGWGLQLMSFGVYLGVCVDLVAHACKTVVDKSNINGTFYAHRGITAKSWTAGQLDDGSGRYVLTVAEPVKADPLDLTMDWDDYIFQALSFMGLPSNEGRFDTVLEGAGGGPGQDLTIRFDYTILATDAGFVGENAWVFSLEVNGVDALLTFEDGSEVPFRVGTPLDVVVPVGADVNGDGRVDVRVDFDLDATFRNTWDHSESAGYMYTAGFGRLRALDDDGYIVGEHKVGPAIERFCAPKIPGGPIVPLHCYTTHEVEPYAFRPTGFTSMPLRGGLDLSGP